MLTANADLYSTGPFDMGRTSLIEHAIDTGNHKPIKQALRRHPLAHQAEIDRQVSHMLQADIIEPAASPGRLMFSLSKRRMTRFACVLIIEL